MKKEFVVIIATILILIFVSLLYFKNNSEISFSKEVSINNTVLKVAISDTNEERARGLSKINEIKDNEGMIFIFGEPALYGIWMKEMNFPIDVIWFNSEMKVISIKESFLPSSFPEVAYPSEKAFLVLETKAGFVKDHKILIGDELKISK